MIRRVSYEAQCPAGHTVTGAGAGPEGFAASGSCAECGARYEVLETKEHTFTVAFDDGDPELLPFASADLLRDTVGDFPPAWP